MDEQRVTITVNLETDHGDGMKDTDKFTAPTTMEQVKKLRALMFEIRDSNNQPR